MGMIGGGQGAFIGEVHRMAARLDGEIELVCGAFSSDPDRSRASGKAFYLDPARCYGNYEEMIHRENDLPADQRMDFVAIVTPNHLHFAPAKLALQNGYHVICDKPVTLTSEQALELKEIYDNSSLIFALTHNYTGYPMVRQARAMIRAGELGTVRRVMVEYPQGWLTTRIEESGQKQASWRTNPKKSGKAGCMGDIGTHAENLLEYVSGLKITQLCASLHTFVDGRLLDDDGSVLLRLEGGAHGLLMASQICAGEENNLRIRVYGTKAGLDWCHESPNSLTIRPLDSAKYILRTGVGDLSSAARAATRLPAGHPEGFIEAFANIYRFFARAIRSQHSGEVSADMDRDFPTLEDGIRGMRFIDRVVESAQSDLKYIDF